MCKHDLNRGTHFVKDTDRAPGPATADGSTVCIRLSGLPRLWKRKRRPTPLARASAHIVPYP
jgi:hypothetical protein